MFCVSPVGRLREVHEFLRFIDNDQMQLLPWEMPTNYSKSSELPWITQELPELRVFLGIAKQHLEF